MPSKSGTSNWEGVINGVYRWQLIGAAATALGLVVLGFSLLVLDIPRTRAVATGNGVDRFLEWGFYANSGGVFLLVLGPFLVWADVSRVRREKPQVQKMAKAYPDTVQEILKKTPQRSNFLTALGIALTASGGFLLFLNSDPGMRLPGPWPVWLVGGFFGAVGWALVALADRMQRRAEPIIQMRRSTRGRPPELHPRITARVAVIGSVVAAGMILFNILWTRTWNLPDWWLDPLG